MMAAYSISKAALVSLSQSLRVQPSDEAVRVQVVLAGPVDTDMTRPLQLPKASPHLVAQAIFERIANGDEEIFPDPMSRPVAEDWRVGPTKSLERAFAGLAAPVPVN